MEKAFRARSQKIESIVDKVKTFTARILSILLSGIKEDNAQIKTCVVKMITDGFKEGTPQTKRDETKIWLEAEL